MLKEFKEFALRGNVMDMAVGVIIGAAFSTIVRSLVDDIIMPPIGVVTGGVDFSSIFIALNGEHYDSLAAARQAGAPTMNIGLFINNVISFLIVAFVLFMAIKAMNQLRRKQEEEPASEPPPSREVQLLEEIRDALVKRGSGSRRLRRGRERMTLPQTAAERYGGYAIACSGRNFLHFLFHRMILRSFVRLTFLTE